MPLSPGTKMIGNRVWVPRTPGFEGTDDPVLQGMLSGDLGNRSGWGWNNTNPGYNEETGMGGQFPDAGPFLVPEEYEGGWLLPEGLQPYQYGYAPPDNESLWSNALGSIGSIAIPALTAGLINPTMASYFPNLSPLATSAIVGAGTSAVTGGDPMTGAATGAAGNYLWDTIGNAMPSFEGASAQPMQFAAAPTGTMLDAQPPWGLSDIATTGGGTLAGLGGSLPWGLDDPATTGGGTITPSQPPWGMDDPATTGGGMLSPTVQPDQPDWGMDDPASTGGGTIPGAGATSGGVGGKTLATAGGAAALAKILKGDGSPEDYLSLLGAAAPGLIGAYAADRQGDALSDLAAREDARIAEFRGYGAPSRARYEGSFAPGFDITKESGYTNAMDTTTDTLLRRLSASSGNPWGDPGGLAEVNKYVAGNVALPYLNQYRTQNANTGGYAPFNTAATGSNYNANAAAVGADTNVWNAFGAAAGNVFNPPRTLADLARELKSLGGGYNNLLG